MNTIANNIKTMWNACGHTAECYVNAVKRELGALEKGWEEAEEFWKEHPETVMEYLQF